MYNAGPEEARGSEVLHELTSIGSCVVPKIPLQEVGKVVLIVSGPHSLESPRVTDQSTLYKPETGNLDVESLADTWNLVAHYLEIISKGDQHYNSGIQNVVKCA